MYRVGIGGRFNRIQRGQLRTGIRMGSYELPISWKIEEYQHIPDRLLPEYFKDYLCEFDEMK